MPAMRGTLPDRPSLHRAITGRLVRSVREKWLMYKHRSCATQFWQNEAKRRGTIALRERLARVRQGQGLGLADRLLAIGRACAARLKEPLRSADHGDLLYDDLDDRRYVRTNHYPARRFFTAWSAAERSSWVPCSTARQASIVARHAACATS